MMNVLITGGAGFIGSHLAEALLYQGHHVVLLDNLTTGNRENVSQFFSNPRFKLITGSVLEDRALEPLVEEADLIYHLAAFVGVKYILEHPLEMLQTNTLGTENVLRTAQRFGNKKVILASTSEVYGKSPNIPYVEDGDLVLGPTSVGRWGYACSKILDELISLAYHKEHDLPVVILRLFNTVGPRQSGRYGMVLPRFVSQALDDAPITVHGDGSQSRCFTYVGDAVKAMVEIAGVPQAEGQIFNLGSEREITINHLASAVKETLRSGSPIVHVPYDTVFGPDFEDINRRVPDISKIRRFIDFRPDTDIQQVIQEVAAERIPGPLTSSDLPVPSNRDAQ